MKSRFYEIHRQILYSLDCSLVDIDCHGYITLQQVDFTQHDKRQIVFLVGDGLL